MTGASPFPLARLLRELYPLPRPPQQLELTARLRPAALLCPGVRRLTPQEALTGDMDNPVVGGSVGTSLPPVYADRPGQQVLPQWVWAEWAEG